LVFDVCQFRAPDLIYPHLTEVPLVSVEEQVLFLTSGTLSILIFGPWISPCQELGSIKIVPVAPEPMLVQRGKEVGAPAQEAVMAVKHHEANILESLPRVQDKATLGQSAVWSLKGLLWEASVRRRSVKYCHHPYP
jgi:hypothetical protein